LIEFLQQTKIHFRAYPRDVLQPVRGSVEETLQATYLNSLKEAAYVLTGNSNAVMSLSKKSQQELLQNVLEAQQVEFHQNMQKMDLTKPLVSRKAPSRRFIWLQFDPTPRHFFSPPSHKPSLKLEKLTLDGANGRNTRIFLPLFTYLAGCRKRAFPFEFTRERRFLTRSPGGSPSTTPPSLCTSKGSPLGIRKIT